MSRETLSMDDRLLDYLYSVSLRESPVAAELRAETARMPQSNMQIAPEQGQLMALLIRLMGARRCIEVGTFTGYSALVCAEALPPDGRLVTLDRNEEWTDMARSYWRKAGVDQLIELRLGDAEQSLEALLSEGGSGRYDFMFVDADKTPYRRYTELGLRLLRPGGLLAFDNVLWNGSVADPADRSEDTEALRIFNEWLYECGDVDLAMVPIGDGLSLARKR